jgi:ribosomal protein S14
VWVHSEPTEDEEKLSLGAQVCLVCGQRQQIDSDGEVVSRIHGYIPPSTKFIPNPFRLLENKQVSTRQHKWQEKMKAQGRCPECGRPTDRFILCDYHRELAREKRRRSKEDAEKAGVST